MSRPLRIAQVAPVAKALPPDGSGSVELVTSILTEGLVARGHEVTLFATGESRTSARLVATFERGYATDPQLWPWELCELLNCAAAMERASAFDIIHVQAEYSPLALAFARLVRTPLVQTVHYAPKDSEVRLWARHAAAPFIALSADQARCLAGLPLAGVVRHGLPMDQFAFRASPDDYVVFLGRFTEGKGVVQAIDIAGAAGLRLLLAGPANAYFLEHVAARVDGRRVVYVGEVDHAGKVALLGGARALLYPVQQPEPFGLVLAEAMACGTPVAALDRGAVREVVTDGAMGEVFDSERALIDGLPRVLALDRSAVRRAAERELGADRMVEEYLAVYRRVVAARRVAGG